MTSAVASNALPPINRKTIDNNSRLPSAVKRVRNGRMVDVGLTPSAKGRQSGHVCLQRKQLEDGRSVLKSARVCRSARNGKSAKPIRAKTFGRSAKGKSGRAAKGGRVGALLATEAHESTNSEDYDTDFDSDASSDVDIDGRMAYISACQALGVSALPRALAQWSGPCLALNYRNLAAAGAKALSSALILNPNVVELELQENRLGGTGAMYISTHLKENVFITKLNVAGNNLGSVGAEAMGELLSNNNFITDLNLADNNFRDSDGEHLARGIETSDGLKVLDLSHNYISEDGAVKIGKAIGKNISLAKINMSWNQLRRMGAVAICSGVKRNANVTHLNLAWNGLGYEGSLAVGEMLRGNHYLLELDVTSNRVNWEGARLIGRGLTENSCLEILKMGHNPLTMTGCMDVLSAIDGYEDSVVNLLDLEGVPVNKRLLALAEGIQRRRPFKMPHGGVVEGEDVLGRRPSIKKDPIQQLMDFLTESGIRPVDLFRQLKQDDRNMVSKEAFIQGLQMAKAPMKQHELEQILDSIQVNKEGKISFNILMKGVKEQIKVNREEEKRRMEQENKFIEERKRLMNVTPSSGNPSDSEDDGKTPDWKYDDDDFEDDDELDQSLMFSGQSSPAKPTNQPNQPKKHEFLHLPAVQSKDVLFSRSTRFSKPGTSMATQPQQQQKRFGSNRFNLTQRFNGLNASGNNNVRGLGNMGTWDKIEGHKFGTQRERPQEKRFAQERKPQRLVPLDPRAQMLTTHSLGALHEGALLSTSLKVGRSLPLPPKEKHNQLKPLPKRKQREKGKAARQPDD